MGYVVLDQTAIRRVLRSRSGFVARDLTMRALAVQAAAKRLAPVRTGRLRSSIRWSLIEGPEGLAAVVGTDVAYAPYVHGGTRPHTILPRNRQALFWKGAQHPVAVVQHPGTRARPFLREALRAGRR